MWEAHWSGSAGVSCYGAIACQSWRFWAGMVDSGGMGGMEWVLLAESPSDVS